MRNADLQVPDNGVEVARLTTRTGRTLLVAFYQPGGYGYTGQGCGGRGLTLVDVVARLNNARDWPGGKTATLTGITSLFQQPDGVYGR